MASLCSRCALRLHRTAATIETRQSSRTFSQSTAKRKHHGVPAFIDTPNPELNDTLLSLRTNHFIPAHLSQPELRLIHQTKNRQYLLDNPQVANIAGEEIPLQWLGRQLPPRAKLFRQALDHITSDSTGKAWQNLPALLAGMKDSKAVPGGPVMAEIIHKAALQGRLGVILVCLQSVENTGMSLKHPDVAEAMIRSLRYHAQRNHWSEEAVTRSLKWAEQVAVMMEREEHGGGRRIFERGDFRSQPWVIATFLELAAVDAFRWRESRDEDGKVRMYAERLLDSIDESTAQPPANLPRKNGPQTEMLHGVPIYHGLLLAEKVLGARMPDRERAITIRDDYEAGLEILAQAIEAQTNTWNKTHSNQALKAWRRLIRE